MHSVALHFATCFHPAVTSLMNLRVFLLLPLLCSAQAADLAVIDAYCRKALLDWNVPGFSIAIVKDNRIVMTRGYGLRELNKSDPVTEHTLFAIASNTKAFTTAAIAILAHEKKLNWNDRVQAYLPWFQVFDDPWISHEARIDDLLCHRLGFRTFSGDLIWYNTPFDAEEVVKRARYLKPQFPFRRGHGYSNISFLAAGEVTARASGEAWPAFIRSRLLTPLNMTNTALSVAELKFRLDVATPHGSDEDAKPYPIPWQAWNSMAAAGGIISSAADLAQWLRLQLNEGQLNGRVFWTASEAWKMWSLHNPRPFDSSASTTTDDVSLRGDGLGWVVSDYRGHFIAQHGGAYDGMFSHTTMAPKAKLGVVVLSNGMTPLPRSVASYILDDYLLEKHEKDWSEENLKKSVESRAAARKAKSDESDKRLKDTTPSLSLERYAGRYGGPMYGDATVAVENDKLVLRIEPNPDLSADLVHWQHDVFEIRWHKKFAWFGKGKLQFLLDENSKVTEFKMNVPNEDFWFEELEFKRKPE